MIIGQVRSVEFEDTYRAVPELLRDRHVSLAESETDFHHRARAYLDRTRPGHSDGFRDYVTALAWGQHTERLYRLEIPAAALRRVAEFADTLTDQPGAQQLRAAVANAAAHAGWTTTDTDAGTDTGTGAGTVPGEQEASR